MLQAVLGLPVLEPDEPVPLASVALPQARLEPPAELAGLATAQAEARVRHTYGRSYPDILRGYRGDFALAPDLVVYPRDETEVGACLDWASRAGVPLTPWGGGTSVCGGLTPETRGPPRAVLDLGALDQVLEVDEHSLLARIQAGILGPALEEQLRPHGLTLRHFPQSFRFSTLGGWLATRAGGHFATVYTHIDDLCAGMRVVTPRGVMESRPLPGSGAGPSPDRLMLGSEGIFGVITEGTMRVRTRPRHRSSCSVRFTELEGAVAAVHAISQAALFPSNCRLLDSREAMLNQVDHSGNHVLILGFEGPQGPLTSPMDRALALARAHGGTHEAPHHRESEPADGRSQAATWRQAFFDGPYLQSTLVSLGVVADTFETCVPWSRFEALRSAVSEAVLGTMRAHTGHGVLSMRFTHVYPDGPAPYFTWLAPARRGEELALWTAVKSAATTAILENGGTVTHHHAVGRVHRSGYSSQRPARFGAVLHAVKATLDPAGVLNPGVLIASQAPEP